MGGTLLPFLRDRSKIIISDLRFHQEAAMVHNFPDDDNICLMDIQERLFRQVAKILFTVPARRYLASSRFIGVQTGLSQKVRDALHKKGFAVETYYKTYNYIAVWYRFSRDSHGQLPLPFNGEINFEGYLEEGWLAFFDEMVESLTYDDPMALLLIKAGVETHCNPPTEDVLIQKLKERFPIKSLHGFDGPEQLANSEPDSTPHQ